MTMADITLPIGITIAEMTKVTSLASTDLIEIDRNGAGAAVSFDTLSAEISKVLGLTGITEALEKIIG